MVTFIKKPSSKCDAKRPGPRAWHGDSTNHDNPHAARPGEYVADEHGKIGFFVLFLSSLRSQTDDVLATGDDVDLDQT